MVFRRDGGFSRPELRREKARRPSGKAKKRKALYALFFFSLSLFRQLLAEDAALLLAGRVRRRILPRAGRR